MNIGSGPAMPSAPAETGASDGIRARLLTFSYRGWLFSCAAQRIDELTFRPVVFYRHGSGGEESRLPPDTDNVAYGSEAEALRHAEQQAMRWAQDRSSSEAR
ncbi:hypothetical protein [Variovorax sp. OV084]|jgi:hypothetical protein|uniref:hypothetical protein n=1 Tax=Variovorax sp. OV084 TaxID=1882777 RepID=UPI0008CD55C0|nr:hypothetical protein [Variovorax sp. OV084]SEU23208.1 hypothetical protein SAMN05443580_1368 [Variovorax sp. OV084]